MRVRLEYVLYMMGTERVSNHFAVVSAAKTGYSGGVASAAPCKAGRFRRVSSQSVACVPSLLVHVIGVTRLDVCSSKPYTSAAPEMDVIFEPLPGLMVAGGDDRGFSPCPGVVN